MLKTRGLTLALLLCTISGAVFSQGFGDSLSIPLEVRSIFRNAGCETITLSEAAKTDLGRHKIYVGTCSGLQTYLMAVECRRNDCHRMR